MSITLLELRNEIRRKKEFATWDKLAMEYGVNKGVLWYIVNTLYVPADKEIRRSLGLSVTIEVPVCPVHGIVHTKRCPATNPRTLSDYRDLFAAPVDVLRAALEGREEM